MKIVAIIPVKPFAAGKSRLREILSDAERRALNRAMFTHVLSVATETLGPANTIVVSADGEALELAGSSGAIALMEKSDAGLNAALGEASEQAARLDAEAILVLPTDLPDLSRDDLNLLVEKASVPPFVVIAPDLREKGTNALLLAPPRSFGFAFGPNSFAVHKDAAQSIPVEPTIIRSAGLASDIDTPADYRRLLDRGWRLQG